MPNDSQLTAWPLLNGRMVAHLQEFHFNSNLMLNFFGLLMYSEHTEIHLEPGNVLFPLNKSWRIEDFKSTFRFCNSILMILLQIKCEISQLPKNIRRGICKLAITISKIFMLISSSIICVCIQSLNTVLFFSCLL